MLIQKHQIGTSFALKILNLMTQLNNGFFNSISILWPSIRHTIYNKNRSAKIFVFITNDFVSCSNLCKFLSHLSDARKYLDILLIKISTINVRLISIRTYSRIYAIIFILFTLKLNELQHPSLLLPITSPFSIALSHKQIILIHYF